MRGKPRAGVGRTASVCRLLVLYLHRRPVLRLRWTCAWGTSLAGIGPRSPLTAALTFGAVSVAGPSAPTASAAGPVRPARHAGRVPAQRPLRLRHRARPDEGRQQRRSSPPSARPGCSSTRQHLPQRRRRAHRRRAQPAADRRRATPSGWRSPCRPFAAGWRTRSSASPDRSNALAARLILRARARSTPAFMRNVVPTLQGRGFSADLNYFEPAQPKNGFRPGRQPAPRRQPAARPLKGGRGAESVLVVDSPAPSRTVVYDLDGNGKVDEDHGHGAFVASLVKLLAPTAEVVLAGVHGRQVPALARWSPMMFSDADLIRAMGNAFGLSPGGTAVRRAFNVVNLSLGGAGCDGIAARLPLGRFMRDLAGFATKTTDVAARYVAAAGNDGADVKHFPAAWRDTADDRAGRRRRRSRPRRRRADRRRQPDPPDPGIPRSAGCSPSGRGPAASADSFSNCGKWVNGIADGARAVEPVPEQDRLGELERHQLRHAAGERGRRRRHESRRRRHRRGRRRVLTRPAADRMDETARPADAGVHRPEPARSRSATSRLESPIRSRAGRAAPSDGQRLPRAATHRRVGEPPAGRGRRGRRAR